MGVAKEPRIGSVDEGAGASILETGLETGHKTMHKTGHETAHETAYV